jgi:hypothetical protein
LWALGVILSSLYLAKSLNLPLFGGISLFHLRSDKETETHDQSPLTSLLEFDLICLTASPRSSYSGLEEKVVSFLYLQSAGISLSSHTSFLTTRFAPALLPPTCSSHSISPASLGTSNEICARSTPMGEERQSADVEKNVITLFFVNS